MLSGVATYDWWLVVGVVRINYLIQAGPMVCLVSVMHVAMLRITPHGIQCVHMVMWRVGMSAPVGLPPFEV